MKQLATISKDSVHAAGTRVSAAEGENLAVAGDSQVISSPAATGKGLVWDETTAEAFETIRRVIWYELEKFGLQQYVEDVYQDTYLAAFHSSSLVFDPSKGELGAWFRGIAKTMAKACVRKNLRKKDHECSYESNWEGFDAGEEFETLAQVQTEQVLRVLGSAVGHHAAFERTLINAFRYDGDTAATAEFLGIPKRTVRWSRALVRKFGVVIARALTVRGARIERGKVHDPVTVGELVWCLPSEVDSDVYLMLLAQAGSVDRISQDALVGLTGLSSTGALQYASEITRMLSIARSVVETGTITTAEEEA